MRFLKRIVTLHFTKFLFITVSCYRTYLKRRRQKQSVRASNAATAGYQSESVYLLSNAKCPLGYKTSEKILSPGLVYTVGVTFIA